MTTYPTIDAEGVPTGGIISLAFSGAVSGAAMLERGVSGSPAFTTIYSGEALLNYLDIGDNLPAPLDPTIFYRYRYTDSFGSAVSDFVRPSSILAVQQEPLTQILVRVLQGAINSLVLPDGIDRAQVTHAMPLGGSLKLPLVVVNLDLLRLAQVPIGQSVAALQAVAGGQTITGLARRLYRVSILCTTAVERDFYRDNLAGVFEAIWASVLQPLGLDVSHDWQAASGQVAKEDQAKMPGFYYADFLMDFTGTLNVTISPSYGTIEHIDMTATGAEGSETEAIVPADDS